MEGSQEEKLNLQKCDSKFIALKNIQIPKAKLLKNRDFEKDHKQKKNQNFFKEISKNFQFCFSVLKKCTTQKSVPLETVLMEDPLCWNI